MTQRHKNLRILAFVGLNGSGKATVISYLTQKGYPKVSREGMVSQIDHLADAGQHRVITDELNEFELYKTIKHEFPAELTLIALITEKRTRHHRLSEQIGEPMNEQESSASDWQEVENDQAQLIGIADHHIENDGSIDELYHAIDELITELEFEL